LTLLSCSFFLSPARAADYPQATVKNEHLTLTILLPGANSGYYRGSRFDWSGIVSKVEYGRHTLFQEWKTPHNPEGHDDVGGTAEEFGMLMPPLGYAEAKPGGKFLKIGIGLLTKPDDKPYQFHRNYKVVEPAPWTASTSAVAVDFRQSADGPGGYAYEYRKRVVLKPGETAFTIERTLKNTGKFAIHTDHYGHNFLSFDGKPVGPDYRLTFPADPKPRDKKTDLGDFAALDGPSLVFKKVLDKGTIYAELDGLASGKTHEVTARDVKTGFGVTITGDVPVTEWHVWGTKTALCPEPFVEIKLDPGKSFSWTTRYEVSVRRD
jgi:hypothetical protein